MSIKNDVADLLIRNQGKPVSNQSILRLGAGATARLRELRYEGWLIKTTTQGREVFYTLTRLPSKAKISKVRHFA